MTAHKICLFNKALHNRSAFSCGVQSIDSWLHASISKQIKNDRIKLYCATDESGKLVGFYALNAHCIRPEDAAALAQKGERHEIPVVYLPYIAVDAAHQGQNLGAALMGHAIMKSVEISDKIGAAALVLDVKKDADFEKRLSFYSRFGFQPLNPETPHKVFLSMKLARLSVKRVKPTEAALTAADVK